MFGPRGCPGRRELTRMAGRDGQSIERALAALTGHGIVAGFGIPGRAVANLLTKRGIPYCVVEMNGETVDRCRASGLTIFQGDAAGEADLLRAGIERAVVLALAMPNKEAVLTGIPLARRLNPNVKILARCRHVSTALQAMKAGADEVLSEEQVVAEGFCKMMQDLLAELEGADAAQG